MDVWLLLGVSWERGVAQHKQADGEKKLMEMTHTADAVLPVRARPWITASVILLALLTISLSFFSVWEVAGLVRPDWIVGGLLVVSFLLAVLLRPRIAINGIGWWVLLINLAVVIGTVNLFNAGPYQIQEFVTLWGQLIFASLLLFAISNVKISVRKLQIIMKVWVHSALLVATYGIYQAIGRNMDALRYNTNNLEEANI